MLRSPKEVQHILLLLELPENCLATEKPEEAAGFADSGHRVTVKGHWGDPDAHGLVV